jgi:hypothetical protein
MVRIALDLSQKAITRSFIASNKAINHSLFDMIDEK